MDFQEFHTYTGQLARKAMYEKAKSGYLPGCAPVGYKNTALQGEKLIVPDPVMSKKVRNLFELVAQGKSIRKAGVLAMALGLRSRNWKHLGPSAVYGILTNPFYIGKIRYNGQLLPGRHQPIISGRLFEGVQERLSGSN